LLAQQVGQGADVVLVAVREHDRLDLVQPGPDVAEIRQDQVDAGLLLLREQHAAVDDQQPAAVLEHGHVAADLTQAAERDDPEAGGRQRGRWTQLRVRVAHRSGRLTVLARAVAGTTPALGASAPRALTVLARAVAGTTPALGASAPRALTVLARAVAGTTPALGASAPRA